MLHNMYCKTFLGVSLLLWLKFETGFQKLSDVLDLACIINLAIIFFALLQYT